MKIMIIKESFETRVTFSVADLKALGIPLFTSVECNCSASFEGAIAWDYEADYEADEEGLSGLHWYASKLDDDDRRDPVTGEWIPIHHTKRSVDILGDQVAKLYDQARDHLQELAGDL